MEPHPLARVLTHPPLDDIVEQLRRSCHVDSPLGIPRQREGRRKLEPEAMIGQPDHANAVHRAIDGFAVNGTQYIAVAVSGPGYPGELLVYKLGN